MVIQPTKDVLPVLVTKATLSILADKFERKVSGREAVTALKGFTLFISNGDVDNIKIVKSLKDSGVLIDCVTETSNSKYSGEQEEKKKMHLFHY